MPDATETLKRINDAWRGGNLDDLAECFAPDMVIVGPSYAELATGRDACIASYRDFLRASTVRTYEESNLKLRESSGVAIATYEWRMDYDQGGRLHCETGTDLFVFVRKEDRWQAIWRAVTFAAS